VTQRVALIEPGHTLSVRRQCQVLRINRSSVYRRPAPDDEEDLLIMKELDKLHMEFPFYGSRKLRLELRKTGRNIN